jgi:hypothetical protein
MSDFSCVEDVKREAEAILQTLRDLNPDTNVPLGHCYELIARRQGYSCWRAYKKELEKEIKEQLPSPVRAPILSQDEFRRVCAEEASTLPEITVDDYTQAVETLLRATRMDGTSGARVCSLVLLGLYNGDDWHFDLVDLCLISGEYYEAAIVAIRGRKEIMMEPHSLVENGDAIFRQLWDDWRRYEKQNAWKPTCTECYGSGVVYSDDEDDDEERTCPTCSGRGYRDPLSETREKIEGLLEDIERKPNAPASDLKWSIKIGILSSI